MKETPASGSLLRESDLLSPVDGEGAINPFVKSREARADDYQEGLRLLILRKTERGKLR